MTKPFIYLASLSPRREELLAQIGVGYRVFVQTSDDGAEAVDETPLAGEPPVDYVSRVARAKADAGWRALLASRYERKASLQEIAAEQGKTANALYLTLRRARQALLECVNRALRVEGWS